LILKYIPSLRRTRPEASYLTWIDCAETKMDFSSFLEGGVALTDGAPFGDASAVNAAELRLKNTYGSLL